MVTGIILEQLEVYMNVELRGVSLLDLLAKLLKWHIADIINWNEGWSLLL